MSQIQIPCPTGLPVFLLAAALFACGSDAPEAQLAEAREQLVEVREQVKQIEEKVQDKRQVVRRAEKALAEARAELDGAEGELEQARAKIDERATDVALFRAVQSALLRNRALEDFAIRAEVSKGMVTLRGVVEKPAQAEEALETARSVTGVDQVVDRIRVREETEASG